MQGLCQAGKRACSVVSHHRTEGKLHFFHASLTVLPTPSHLLFLPLIVDGDQGEEVQEDASCVAGVKVELAGVVLRSVINCGTCTLKHGSKAPRPRTRLRTRESVSAAVVHATLYMYQTALSPCSRCALDSCTLEPRPVPERI
jgi:hypothetical protein